MSKGAVIAGAAGAATGAGAAAGGVVAGAAAGTSGAAAITSGLAAVGSVVGGGMVAGIAVCMAAPVAGLGAGYGVYWLIKRKLE